MKRIFTVVSLLLFLPTFLFASTTGKISGKVTDLQTGEPLIGANVIVVGTSFGAATDTHGEFTINFLNAGVYEVKASYLGYKTVTVSNVRVNADLVTALNFKLPAVGVAVGEVTIVARRPLINTSNTNAIRTTTNEQIEALPIRGVQNIISLTPGVTLQGGNIYVRGGRQDEVGYYLEGTNITNPLVSLAGGIHHSAQQVYVPQDALDEIQVQAGGYTAEFGGANAGIVRSDLKSGGSQLKASVQYLTDNWTFKSSKDRYNGVQNLGTYSYGYNDLTASLSGPVAGNHIKFYGLFENLSQADYNPQFNYGFNYNLVNPPSQSTRDTVNLSYPAGAQEGNNSNRYSGVGTITFDYNPTIVRLIGTYSFLRQRVGANVYGSQGMGPGTSLPITILDLNRLPIQDNYNGDFGLKLTQVLSADAFVEVDASYIFNKGKQYDPQLGDNFWAYGDSAANTNAGVPWTTPFTTNSDPRYLKAFGYVFSAPNAPLLNSTYGIGSFNKFENDNLDFKAALSYNLNKQNSLKIGGEFQLMTVRNYSPPNINLSSVLTTTGLTKSQILIQNGVNNYGYDLEGNVYNGTSNYPAGNIGPHKPIFAGAYIQDRMEYKNLIVNAGLRFDYINTDNVTFADPSNPENVFNKSTFVVADPSQLVKVPTYSSVSPRLGFSFPITDRTVFHAQYGKFVQQPSLAYLYQGVYRTGWIINPNNGFFIANPIGANLRPTRTTNYEIGFTQQIGSVASFDITAYYKDILNQIVFATQNVSTEAGLQGWRPYEILTNGDYATTEGVEISFNMRRTDRFLVNGSISFQNAQGTGDNPYSNSGEFGSPVGGYVFIPQYIEPLGFNHSIQGNLDIDYHYGKDDGPAILHQFGASLLLTFASGHPYTLGTASSPGISSSDILASSLDPRDRYAIEALNSSITPSTFRVDFMIDKAFPVYDQLSADIFIQVLNLFNAKNVENVFNSTGSAETDGNLTNPNLTGYGNIQTYGPEYANVYNSLSLVPAGLYGAPRQIRLGIRLEY